MKDGHYISYMHVYVFVYVCVCLLYALLMCCQLWTYCLHY